MSDGLTIRVTGPCRRPVARVTTLRDAEVGASTVNSRRERVRSAAVRVIWDRVTAASGVPLAGCSMDIRSEDGIGPRIDAWFIRGKPISFDGYHRWER